MTWVKREEGEFNLRTPEGKVLANVRIVGVRGRWRWSCSQFSTKDRNGWCGVKSSRTEAQRAAEDYLRSKGLILP